MWSVTVVSTANSGYCCITTGSWPCDTTSCCTHSRTDQMFLLHTITKNDYITVTTTTIKWGLDTAVPKLKRKNVGATHVAVITAQKEFKVATPHYCNSYYICHYCK